MLSLSRYPLSTVGLARLIHRSLLRPRVAGIAPMIITLSMSACVDGGDRAPPLLGAPGATLPLPAQPVIIEAEGGATGADVQALPDAVDSSITYLTAGVNVTDAPLDRTDPRVTSVAVTFPNAGDYQMYVRARIGPGGGTDDSLFVDIGGDAPNWALVNGLTGFPVQGQPGYQEGSVIDDLRGQSPVGVWMWALIEGSVYTVSESALLRTFVFSTREDGLDIDKFAFAAVGDGYTTGFTTDQLDAGERGVVVYPPVLPDPYEPPADQPPLAVGASKWLGMVCCGNQRPFLENYFNQVTPENGGKWGSVEGTRDVYDWTGADEALAVAQANGFPFRFHVLLWGSQQPEWIATLPPEEQLIEIRQWFEAVNERYGAAITYLEVANEFVNQPPTAANQGNYVEALGGAGVSGFDWVLTAFRMAREIFPPTVQLMLNEYSVINNDELTGRYVALVELLQAEGLIDAIGEQGHAFSTTGPVEQLVTNLNRLGATGLPLLITEMDIDGPEARQLVDFQRLFPAFWENDAVAGITLWGYRPGMWRDPQQATLVYPNGAEKPALRWLKGYLRGTAPIVDGPASVTVASGYAEGADVATFVATDPEGSPYPAGAVTSWGVVPVLGAGAATDASQAVVFDEGTGRLRFEGARLSAGTYSIRIYADVDRTVSNLFDIALTVE
jgi:endo-1,4-beta-xylanase